MQKKENPVIWWVGWITATILVFFISCYFWTGIIARHAGPISKPGVSILWVTAVFGTWMVLLVPLIVLMYSKVDRAYEDARIRREDDAKKKLSSQIQVPVMTVPLERRLLPKSLSRQLKKLPKTLQQGQLVRLEFQGSSPLDKAFVWAGEEVVGVYGRSDFPFDASKATAFQLLDVAEANPVDYKQWLRLD